MAKPKIKLITVVSNSSGRMAHFTVDGKGDSKRFPVAHTDAQIRKDLGVGKADKKADKKDEVSDRIKELRKEAKKLGVKATHFMTSEETLLAKIAEAKKGGEDK